MAASGQAAFGEGRDLPEAPAGVEEQHDQETSREQEEDVVEQPLSERDALRRSGWRRMRGHADVSVDLTRQLTLRRRA
jgi:hypothetical protein